MEGIVAIPCDEFSPNSKSIVLGKENSMTHKIAWPIALMLLPLASLLSPALPARSQKTDTAYASMAPLEEYMMPDRNAEIALAKSAAPKAISDDARVLVLDRKGYSTALEGKNGFVCVVQRSWTSPIDDPDFWSPKVRAPICFNAAGARSFLPLIIAKTNLVLAGKSKDQMFEAIAAKLDAKELPSMEPGAMCYMMSKEGYLNSRAGHWHPHLMFFVPLTDGDTWGADLPGSPVIAFKDSPDRLTIFMVPVRKWSDGTAD